MQQRESESGSLPARGQEKRDDLKERLLEKERKAVGKKKKEEWVQGATAGGLPSGGGWDLSHPIRTSSTSRVGPTQSDRRRNIYILTL
jgi:hypothetical protein